MNETEEKVRGGGRIATDAKFNKRNRQIFGYEGSQAVPARLSGNGRLKRR
jgi:hypothetical protein